MVFDQFILCTFGDREGANHSGKIPLDWFLLRMIAVAKNRNLLLNIDSTQ
jgi:hypothetical protein